MSDYPLLPDYLLLRLLLNSAKLGAIVNMSVKEFQRGECNDSTGTKRFLTSTLPHNTGASGPGTLFWDERSHAMAKPWLSHLRPQVASYVSTFPASSGNKDRAFHSSSGLVCLGIKSPDQFVDMARRLCLGLKGTSFRARVRKSGVYAQNVQRRPKCHVCSIEAHFQGTI